MSAQTKEIGQRIEGGTVYAGVCPSTGQEIHAMPEDAGIVLTFNEAARYVTEVNARNTLGHNDWRLPTREELAVLNAAQNQGTLKGTFNTTGANSSWYLSGEKATRMKAQDIAGVWQQHFTNPHQIGTACPTDAASVRLVRTPQI